MRSLYVLARPSTPDEARQTAFALTLERRGPGMMPHSEIVFIVEQAKRARREAKRPRLASPAANPRPLDPPALFPPPPPDDPDRSALVEARRLLGTFRRDFRHRFGAARTLTALCGRIDGLAISGQMEIAQVLPDGINLLPALTGNAAAVDRKLFWRYKGKWQRAARIGDYKFLKILDNTFLSNVVEDPLERGNLKERHKDVCDRIVAEWQAWNASMLPGIADSFTRSFTGEELADHYGSQKASGAPDPTVPLPPAAQSR